MLSTPAEPLYLRSPRLNRLLLLEILAPNPTVTQAELARRTGLSVAMINNYMKELCSAGLLEYRRRTSKSISYHVTEAGERHCRAIDRELVRQLVDFYVGAKARLRDLIFSQASGMPRRVVLYGSGPLAELVFHALESSACSVIAVCDLDPRRAGRDWCGREVLDPSQIKYIAPDAVIVAEEERTDDVYRSLRFLPDRGIRVIRLDGAAAPPVSEVPEPGAGDAVAKAAAGIS